MGELSPKVTERVLALPIGWHNSVLVKYPSDVKSCPAGMVKFDAVASSEMKFAHIRVSEYFTFAEQIFHSEAISLARRANFTEKSHPLARMAEKNRKSQRNPSCFSFIEK